MNTPPLMSYHDCDPITQRLVWERMNQTLEDTTKADRSFNRAIQECECAMDGLVEAIKSQARMDRHIQVLMRFRAAIIILAISAVRRFSAFSQMRGPP